ncbi:hypothetical protein, conserved [Plasmodium gonderi]|uniref:Uncharacterized protein n=1 Tax=Plasmodium gonderi TaxID=77519 RepID=A0A1Y1JBL6_PLAGO|nr:hypothetical protein, conserved [Plasmodium gonderi]GAW79068.1 hypothetical protein, conserved [Plasmodium gonderi]
MEFNESEKKKNDNKLLQNIEANHSLTKPNINRSKTLEESSRKAIWSDAFHLLKNKNQTESETEGKAEQENLKGVQNCEKKIEKNKTCINADLLTDGHIDTNTRNSIEEGVAKVTIFSNNPFIATTHGNLSPKWNDKSGDKLINRTPDKPGKHPNGASEKYPNGPSEKSPKQQSRTHKSTVHLENMNACNSDNKKNYYLMKQAVFFTPKKNSINASNEKKEIENKIVQNGIDEYSLNNNLRNHSTWTANTDQRKIGNFSGTIWKTQDTLLSLNNGKSTMNQNNANLSTSLVSFTNNIAGGAEYTVGGTDYNSGEVDRSMCDANNCISASNNLVNTVNSCCSVSSSLTLQGNNFNTPSLSSLNLLQNNSIMNGKVGGNNDNSLEHLHISSQCFSEKKKDIVYLFQELLSYCECLKRNRKKSTEEINKIRISYNKVSDLLKETLKREKNSHIKIEELRNIIITYDEKFDRVKNSSEGTITNLNKNVQTLIDLNNSLEMEMNKVVNENQQLRKIAQNEFNLNKEINDLRKQIEILNNEKIVLVNQIDGLRLENSKIENEKNVLLSDKTLLHCKIDELENGLKNKNKNNFFNKSHSDDRESNPFIINSDEEINQQLSNYLNLNHEQRTELFKNFLYHWRETNKAGQKFYEQSYVSAPHIL